MFQFLTAAFLNRLAEPSWLIYLIFRIALTSPYLKTGGGGWRSFFIVHLSFSMNNMMVTSNTIKTDTINLECKIWLATSLESASWCHYIMINWSPPRVYMAALALRQMEMYEWTLVSGGYPWWKNRDISSALAHAPQCSGFQSSNGQLCTRDCLLTCCLHWRGTSMYGGGVYAYYRRWKSWFLCVFI